MEETNDERDGVVENTAAGDRELRSRTKTCFRTVRWYDLRVTSSADLQIVGSCSTDLGKRRYLDMEGSVSFGGSAL